MVMKSVKLASILFYLNSVFVVSCFVSCGSSPTEASSLLTADIRGGMDKPGLLELDQGGYFCPFRGDHG